MRSDKEIIEDLQSRVLAYEPLFQSLFYSLPQEIKGHAIKIIEQNFSAFDGGTTNEESLKKLKAAKVIASRVSGAKL